MNNNSTYQSSSNLTFEWLTPLFGSMILICSILLFILGFYCFRRRHRLKQNRNLYYKSSTTTSGSCVSASSGSTLPINKTKHLFLSNNYDDITSELASYIYPITSTTSLLQTSSPSSLFKSEQYAVIDGNYSYQQWPTNNVKNDNEKRLILNVFLMFRHFIMLLQTLDK